MNKTCKKILGIAAVALLISVALAGAGAAEGNEGNIQWTWNNNIVTYTGSGELTSTIVDNSLSEFTGQTFEAVIGTGITSIERYAFNSCAKLTTISIPGSVTDIGDYAFALCTSLTSINVDSNNPKYSSIDGVLFNKSKTQLIQCPAGKSGEYNISNSVTDIDDFAFSSCTSLTSINVESNNPKYSSIDGVLFNKSKTQLIQCPAGKSGEYNIPNGVTSIEIQAFNSCAKLISITIPDTVTSIGGAAFESCTGLTEIIIPDSVTSIGVLAFSGCNGLTSVTIPSSVTSIGDYAFSFCAKLTSINVESNNPNYSSTNGVLFNKSKTLLIQYPTGKSGNYKIPNGVTSIGEGAFENCTGLTSVTIPDSVISIETLAFYGCSNMTSVYIGNSVTSIKGAAFGDCTELKRINLTGKFETAPTFGDDVFYSCTGPIYIVSSELQSNEVIGNFIQSIAYGTSYIPVCYITNVDESELESIEYYVVDLKGGVLADTFVQSYEFDAYFYPNPKLPTSSDISRTGYSFGGWYKDAALTEKFDESAVLTTQNNKAYAKWTKISTSSSSVTSFSGVKDGNDFTFEKAVVITKATLPGATYATVTNTSGSGWYTCNLSTDGTNGILYFQVPLDVLNVKGYTINDVSLIGCKTTYLKSENGYAKYSAVITKGGALTIDFEKDAATAGTVAETPVTTTDTQGYLKITSVPAGAKIQIEGVNYIGYTPQEKISLNPGVYTVTLSLDGYEDAVKTVIISDDATSTVTADLKQKSGTTVPASSAKSPFPVLGILAGLGAAAFFLRRR